MKFIKFIVSPLVAVGMVFGAFLLPLWIGWEYARYWYASIWNN